jgi:hypothetical protein
MLVEQPLNLVKKDRKRKLSSVVVDGKSEAVLCKLCNCYVPRSLFESHTRYRYSTRGLNLFHYLQYICLKNLNCSNNQFQVKRSPHFYFNNTSVVEPEPVERQLFAGAEVFGPTPAPEPGM